MAEARTSARRRIAVGLGLAWPVGGEPDPGGPRLSRFGRFVPPRLDQEVADLRRRVAELEALLRDRPVEPPQER